VIISKNYNNIKLRQLVGRDYLQAGVAASIMHATDIIIQYTLSFTIIALALRQVAALTAARQSRASNCWFTAFRNATQLNATQTKKCCVAYFFWVAR